LTRVATHNPHRGVSLARLRGSMATKKTSKDSRNGARKHSREQVSRESGANPAGAKAAKQQTGGKGK
jgi:hypothetical protein